jgi:hypothetical protein
MIKTNNKNASQRLTMKTVYFLEMHFSYYIYLVIAINIFLVYFFRIFPARGALNILASGMLLPNNGCR